MMEQQLTTTQLEPLPTEIESPQAKLVYLYLEASGGATASDLNEVLAMKKIGVLSVLNCLTEEGLVEKNGADYVPCN
ncbi:MarR family transcriptional regulator [Natronococcus sp. A-GB7]|uniref:MarR family transcriptional regulator n=1 Tax=Natronococcus sp. A-GB7 TaxID=3037649 RepID=UPI00241F5C41|nr:MarR family transcriptional regulator [Natronococcus sp. A-GB7]MDG5820040.1 MarR family transcriptional regulator [Natronococcus sp. A-GB7]